jgi:DNA excision repair protein ERCC-3
MSDLADDVVKVGNEMLKLDSAVKAFQLRIQEIKDSAQASVDAALVTKGVANADMDLLHRFLSKPYLILPKTETQWYLIVPRFVDMQLGILERQTDEYNLFVIDHYVDWITPLPRDIKDVIGMKEAALQATVGGTPPMMDVQVKDTDTAFEKYRPYLLRREEPGKLKVKQGLEFDLIDRLIQDGVMPFAKTPLSPEDLRDTVPSFELREYQKAAWARFQDSGAIGVYWAPGMGKMFLGLYALCRIKGRKLIVVPGLSLMEEWKRKCQLYLPEDQLGEVNLTTYIGAEKVLKNEYSLIIFDESQHLPANTYARMSTIRAKYRIGLSATPFREDGRTDLIFALTGFPVGLDWRTFMEKGVIPTPQAYVYVCPSLSSKLKQLRRLVDNSEGRTLIFCDSLDLGAQISRELEVPFIHGESRNRLSTISQNRVSVISRVGDEGIDITDLQNVIEFDFLFGSRRQELQRYGRLLHSRFKGRHSILMTDEEYKAHSKRLLSLFEKGFSVRLEAVQA